MILGCFLSFFLGILVSTKGQECQTTTVSCAGEIYYPNFDGSCNNEDNPSWGSANTPHTRLLPADYGPGESPRGSYSNEPLPKAREVSNALREDQKKFSNTVTRLHVLWGQFLSHDIARTPMTTNGGEELECACDDLHPECINILIDKGDEQRAEKDCFSFARSSKAVGLGCQFPQREQINEITSYIDGSQVYGASAEESEALRDANTAGNMLTQNGVVMSDQTLLPNQDSIYNNYVKTSVACPALVHKPRDTPCFIAGDVRVNENTGLSAMHTVWMRYHNKVAEKLKNENPRWRAGRVYNEARTILIALLQIITYREYLPALLGERYMQRFGLTLEDAGYWYGYDADVNPTVPNAFATAAFRYGHSMFADILTQRDSEFGKYPDLKLEDAFFNNEPLLGAPVGERVGAFMRGFMTDEAEKMDSSLADDFRNKLFKEFGDTFGGDLLSFNIQRGRDHGLPGYNQYRELCGLKKAVTFQDLSDEISGEGRLKLDSVYNSVDEIDLYAGGISENSVPGGQLGPTVACLMAHGFRGLRRGDRFWHEIPTNPNSPSGFTLSQLAALRQTSFASVLCDVADDMTDVKSRPLLLNSEIVSCDVDVTSLDLSPWKISRESNDRSMQDASSEPPSLEWTRWFVTDSDGDLEQLAAELRTSTDGEICETTWRTETVNVGTTRYIHVRFACAPGTIKASDFPMQISENTCYTEWKAASAVDGGIAVLPNELCENAIALQARVVDGTDFARETEDVFQSYSTSKGFRCVDAQQLDGSCEKYEIRVLCPAGRCGPAEAP